MRKLLLFLFALLGMSSAWAETITVSSSTGTFYQNRGASEAKTWNNYWVSNSESPQLIMQSAEGWGAGYGNIFGPATVSKDDITYNLDIRNNYAYSFTVNGGFLIKEISVKAYASGGANTITDKLTSTNYVFEAEEVKDVKISCNAAHVSNAFQVAKNTALYAVIDVTIEVDPDYVAPITDLANLSNGKSYIIHGVRGTWSCAAADATTMTYTTSTEVADNQKIALLRSETTGKIYPYSVLAGKFLVGDATSGNPIGLSDTPEPIYITSTGNATYPWFFSFTNDKSAQNVNISSSALKVMTYSTFDEGNRWLIREEGSFSVPDAALQAIAEIEDQSVTVTYNVKISGIIVASAEADHEVGDAPSAPASLVNSYISLGNPDIDAVSKTNNVVTYNATVTGLPFTVSTDFENATWYYLHGHASNSNKYISTNGDATVWSDGKIMEDEKYLWAFMGNPYSIKLVNKATGEGKYLMKTNPAKMGTTEDGWLLKQQATTTWSSGDKGFGLYDATLTYLNTQGTTLKYWGDFDQGSTFWVEEVPDNYAANVIAEIKPWFDAAGDGLFQLNGSVKETNNATYTAALTSCDLATYQSLLNIVSDASNFNYPATGYYRIKSALYANRYISLTNEAGLTTIESENDKSASTIVYLNETDAENHTYAISLQGLYALAPSQSARVTMGNTGANFTAVPTSPGVGTFTTGSQYGAFHCAASQSNNIVGWTYDAGASQWTVEAATDVELKLNNGGDGNCYATLCVPFDVTISGADAYTLKLISNAKGNWLSPTPVEGNKVPAGTPVLLKGNSDEATLTIGTGYAASPLTGTALTGTYFAVDVYNENCYVLGNIGNSGVGFYNKWNFTLGANRAYYNALANPGIKGFAINWGETDGIRSIDNGQLTIDNSIFNLNGQRVNKAQKGIYIVNGKKTVIK